MLPCCWLYVVSLFVFFGQIRSESSREEYSDESYRDAQVLRVKAVTQDQKKLLEKWEEENLVDIWQQVRTKKHLRADIMVPAEDLESIKEELRNVSAKFRVMIPDVQTAIEEEEDVFSQEDLDLLQGRKAYRLTWSSYYKTQDIYDYLDYLATTYPTICSVITIGTSLEGRPLKVIKISNGGGAKPSFFIDGGIHAREWVSPASVTYVIQQLVENRSAYAFADKITFYIMPLMNPDGYEYSRTTSRLWRKNRRNPEKKTCAGVDLNRNWGLKWGGIGSSRSPCMETYHGTEAFSEPETLAVRDFILGIGFSMKGYVTFHSYGQYILYPWGHIKESAPNGADLDRVGKKAAAKMLKDGGGTYLVGNSAKLLYRSSGVSDDWAYGVAGIPLSYTVELRDTGRYGFLLPASLIQTTAKEAFAAVHVIAEEITTVYKYYYG